MSNLNESQRKIAEQLNGMIVVDAGPGTGKTKTVEARYFNLISQDDISPKDVLVLTFTNNAAQEMDSRIKNKLAENGMVNQSKLVQTSTFDSFCLSIVMDSPEIVGEMFGITERLTRGASIVQNNTLNNEWFMSFLDDFLVRRGEDYGEWAAIASDRQVQLLKLINKLMSKGVYPLKNGWFGLDYEKQLKGCTNDVLNQLVQKNEPKKNVSELVKILKKLDSENTSPKPEPEDTVLPQCALEEAADEDRTEMFRFIHDVYLDYIRRSIASDRLTFGLNAMLAFAVLYSSQSVRERNSYRYVMIDEFQDTNAGQLMISLMILKEPNLCVVGDWKQGIYGFRYVSIENITDFERRVVSLRRFLNDDTVRIPFQIPEVTALSLDTNYRSSGLIIDKAFECMSLKGTEKDSVDERILQKVTHISAGRNDIGEENTHIRYVQSKTKEEELTDVVRAVRDYIGNGYEVCKDDTRRPMRFGDIAVLCRNTKDCSIVMDALTADGIPAYLQGDVEIMSTREGKLALAWLRYINNERDPWGYIPIMADMGYTLADIKKVKNNPDDVPVTIRNHRAALYQRRRRITDVLSGIFGWYGLDNDITQSIITVLSSAYRGSLVTISDLIRIIEDDIESGTRYEVENSIDMDAVRIMTMHKSKGLEFEAVIIPFIDTKIMPSTTPERDDFTFSERNGIRCGVQVHDFGGYRKIVKNWRTSLVKGTDTKNYNEERRLMFVAMSRARQYETLICGPEPSKFMDGLQDGYTTIPDAELPPVQELLSESNRPDVSGYQQRRRRMGVHEIMDFGTEDGLGGMEDRPDEISGKGKEYGQRVHEAAQALAIGRPVSEDYPELTMIREVLESVSRAPFVYAETDCVLPIKEPDVILKGRIDLIAVYDDRIEVHDWKTDASRRFEKEYKIQLSVYAHAASLYYGKKAECFIQYVSLGETEKFDPLPMEMISERVSGVIRRESSLEEL